MCHFKNKASKTFRLVASFSLKNISMLKGKAIPVTGCGDP
jgi:hypothetical protein